MTRRRHAPDAPDYGLELLLDYHGRVIYLDGGYSMRFSIRRTAVTPERPHGITYSFTLHDQRNQRVIGFDNAHGVGPLGRNATRPTAYDHRHVAPHDTGRPYRFTDAATLLSDFFDACERYLDDRGITLKATGDDSPAGGKPDDA